MLSCTKRLMLSLVSYTTVDFRSGKLELVFDVQNEKANRHDENPIAISPVSYCGAAIMPRMSTTLRLNNVLNILSNTPLGVFLCPPCIPTTSRTLTTESDAKWS
jgi:hypothetical protein